MKILMIIICLFPFILNGQINLSALHSSRTFTHIDMVNKKVWTGFTTTLYSEEFSPYDDSRIKLDVHFIKVKGNAKKGLIRFSTVTNFNEYDIDEEAYIVLEEEVYKITVTRTAPSIKIEEFETNETVGRTSMMTTTEPQLITKYEAETSNFLEAWKNHNKGYLQLNFGGIPYSFELSKAMIKRIKAL